MGPFPHDAPRAQISQENPAGTDGFEFVEFAHPEPAQLHALFKRMGFTAVAKHRRLDTTLYRQGDVNYLVSATPGSHAARFAEAHGPCVPSMAFRVVDAAHAYAHAIGHGAKPVNPETHGALTLAVPAIEGIGGSLIYFVDKYSDSATVYDAEFEWLGGRGARPDGAGLFFIDHLTHNVHRGRMDVWFDFYARIFNFRQIRFFDIEGRHTGLTSRALTSPDGRIRIPLNRPTTSRRSKNTCTPIRAKAFSISPAAPTIFSAPLAACAMPAWPSCRRRPTRITPKPMTVCRAMAKTSTGCANSAS
jgi:4-hydroxyphenylpyruvate dioxygenase